MKTVRANLILIVVAVLTLGAGVTGGLLIARVSAAAAGGTQHTFPAGTALPSPLAEELRLTPSQREQLRTIWEGVNETVQDCFEQARGIQRQREDALVALLSPEQKSRFERIAADYAQRFDGVVQRRNAAFDNAVKQTRQILDPGQRDAYDKMLQKRLGKDVGRHDSASELLAPPPALRSDLPTPATTTQK